MKKPKAKTWRWTGNKLEKRQWPEQLPAPQATDRALSSRGDQCQPANESSVNNLSEKHLIHPSDGQRRLSHCYHPVITPVAEFWVVA